MILFARLIIVVFTSFLAQISLADKLPLAQISKYLNDLKNDKSFIDTPNNVAELFKDK